MKTNLNKRKKSDALIAKRIMRFTIILVITQPTYIFKKNTNAKRVMRSSQKELCELLLILVKHINHALIHCYLTYSEISLIYNKLQFVRLRRV
jgi:hypothetical protein